MEQTNVIKIFEEEKGSLEYGRVEAIEHDQFIITNKKGTFPAKKAFSCLVSPEPGDLVAFSNIESKTCFVLAVLKREHSDATTLQFPGNVRMEVKNGHTEMISKDNLKLASANAIEMISNQFKVTALDGDFTLSNIRVIGTELLSQMKTIKTIAGSIDTVADRITQRAKDCYRWISGTDQLQANSVIKNIKKVLSIKTERAAIIAKGDVKLDGKRINLG
jgi:hypothetical protein